MILWLSFCGNHSAIFTNMSSSLCTPYTYTRLYVNCISAKLGAKKVQILGWTVSSAWQAEGSGPPISRKQSNWLHCRFPLAIYSTHSSVFMSNLIFQFIPLSPSPLCPDVHSLCLHLCSYPQSRFTCTIFLDSTYVC